MRSKVCFSKIAKVLAFERQTVLRATVTNVFKDLSVCTIELDPLDRSNFSCQANLVWINKVKSQYSMETSQIYLEGLHDFLFNQVSNLAWSTELLILSNILPMITQVFTH